MINEVVIFILISYCDAKWCEYSHIDIHMNMVKCVIGRIRVDDSSSHHQTVKSEADIK